MANKPLVSVVMSAFNAAPYIRRAIESILNQTFKDFELVVIDDGSTDGTADIIRSYTDHRITLISRKNKGLVASLNEGIAASHGKLIARHDADDASEPTRLEEQIAFLQTHPEVVLVGSSMQTMNMSGNILHEHYVLLYDAELKQELLIRSPFAHGSVIFRKDAFVSVGGYKQEDWPAEDYGLWLRMASQGEFANLDKPLYLYRENDAGISLQNQTKQIRSTKAVQKRAWKHRKQLMPRAIAATDYATLPMGQLRIARIVQNFRAIGIKSLARLDFITALTTFRLLSSNRVLRRKCVRLFLVTIGVRHGY